MGLFVLLYFLTPVLIFCALVELRRCDRELVPARLDEWEANAPRGLVAALLPDPRPIRAREDLE